MNKLSHLLLVIILLLFLATSQKIVEGFYEEPVCGANHITYSDAYAASRAGVDSVPGKCLEPAKDCGCKK